MSLVNTEAPSGQSGRLLLGVVLLGGLVRALLWWWWRETPELIVDAQDYNRLAVGLVETGRYVTESGELSSLRPPLYPLLVSWIYRLAGVENFAAVRAVQALVSLGTVVIVYRLGTLVENRHVGLVAATLTAFYPTLLGYNNLLLTETPFTCLMTASIWLILESSRRQCWRLVGVSGAVLGLGALARSVLWLFMPIAVIGLFALWPGKVSRRLGAALLLCLTCVLTVFPWIWRNTNVQRTVTFVDVMGGRNVMMGNYEYTPLERSWATISDVKGDRAWDVVLRSRHPELGEATQGQLDKLAMKEGLSFMMSHPWLTLKRTCVRFFNFWQLERELIAGARQGIFGEWSRFQVFLLAGIVVASYVTLVHLSIWGFFLPPWSNRYDQFFVLTAIFFPCAVHSLIFAHSCYHLPGIPLLSIFAARMIQSWGSIRLRWKSPVFYLAVSASIILILGWLRELVFVDFQHLSG